jgi:hypothetical protein
LGFVAQRSGRFFVGIDNLRGIDNFEASRVRTKHIGKREFTANGVRSTDQNNVQMRILLETTDCGGKRRAETVVSAHYIDGNTKRFRQIGLFVVAGLNNFATAIKTIGSDVVTAMSLTAGGVYRQGRAG